MKTAIRILKLTILLCFTFATTAAFGQTLIWTNALMTGTGADPEWSTNWSGPNGPGLNRPVSGTTVEFNGTVPGPLVLYRDIVSGNINDNGGIGPIGGGPGSSGANWYINASQTSPVTISTHLVPVSGNSGLNGITIDNGAGQLTLGDTGSTNSLLFTLRPGGATHDWINNSTNPMIICPNVQWQNGAGSQFTFEFDSTIATPGSGIGDYGITNTLKSSGGSIAVWFVSGGTITWWAQSIPNDVVTPGNVASPIFINAGTTLILKTNTCLSTTAGTGAQAIQNNNPGPGGTPPSVLVYDGGPVNSAQTLSGVIGGGTSPLIAVVVKSGTLTLSGANIYSGGTTISAGTLQVGTNGTSGSVGTGNITNNSVLIFNRSDFGLTVGGAITGSGNVVQGGAGGVTLTGAINITGPTTVSNGTMVITGGVVGGDMNVSGGTLVPSAVGLVGTLNVASNLNVNSGAVLIMVNKSLSPSNSVIIVTNGTITAQAGTTLKLANYGPAFTAGDTFKIFSGPVAGGLGMTVTAPGVTSFINNLAFDGSVTVQTVTTSPMAFTTAARSGANLNLTWPSDWTGVHLQSQTNTLAVGLTTNWITIPGTDAANGYTNILNTTNGSVFFRLAP